MIPQNRSLYQAAVNWAGNFVAATWEGKIYIIKENFNPWNLPSSESTFVHELTHIWQQSVPAPTTFDEDKAHAALIEGDATLMADTYTNLTKADLLQRRLDTSNPDFPADIITLADVRPDTLSNLDYFPYTQGETFVGALHQSGGFPTVNRAYSEGYVPSTTAQILNPELYFENVTANQVSLPNPTVATGPKSRQVTDKTTTLMANTSSKTFWATGFLKAKLKQFQHAGQATTSPIIKTAETAATTSSYGTYNGMTASQLTRF